MVLTMAGDVVTLAANPSRMTHVTTCIWRIYVFLLLVGALLSCEREEPAIAVIVEGRVYDEVAEAVQAYRKATEKREGKPTVLLVTPRENIDMLNTPAQEFAEGCLEYLHGEDLLISAVLIGNLSAPMAGSEPYPCLVINPTSPDSTDESSSIESENVAESYSARLSRYLLSAAAELE